MSKLNFLARTFIPTMLILGSCASENLPELPVSETAGSISESAQIRSIRKYLRNTHKGTRADNYLLTPYVVEGDTVMYIAQYENGWELFSNSFTAPMSLMKCETGTFNEAANTVNLAFKDLLTGIISSLRKNLATEDPDSMPGSRQWTLYSEDTDTEPEPGDGNPVLTLVGSKYIEPENHFIDHLLSTEWGQGYLFNTYMPLRTDVSSAKINVGCTPVAVGQFLYYCHYKWGIPSSAPSKAAYDSSLNVYTFSDHSSAQWDKMFKHMFDSFDPATSLFLGYLAKKLNATPKYDKGVYTDQTSVAEIMIEPIVKQECSGTTTFKILGLKDYNQDRVRSMLLNGMPVISTLDKQDDDHTKGHTVVIDGLDYTLYTSIGYYAYIYPNHDSPEIDTEDRPQDEMGLTYEELVEKYGTIYTLTDETRITYFKFNWGWGGFNNEVLISGDALSIADPYDDNSPYKYGRILDYSVNNF